MVRLQKKATIVKNLRIEIENCLFLVCTKTECFENIQAMPFPEFYSLFILELTLLCNYLSFINSIVLRRGVGAYAIHCELYVD